MKIKICGLRRKEDIEYVNEALPDYIGFVFANGRKRTISEDKALELSEMLSDKITAVGVFLDNDIEQVIRIGKSGAVKLIQLHGHESEEYADTVKRETGLKIIKAFSIQSAQDIDRALSFPADYIMLDNGIGGTGKTFSWSLLKGKANGIFLAGGIDITNIADAAKLSPYCVDVSSGAETDGFKDKDKISALVRAVRDMT